jgi:hypothetical protein
MERARHYELRGSDLKYDSQGSGGGMARGPKIDIAIGKFAILATYTYAGALHEGVPVNEAKQRGMVAAIMGAQARLGLRKDRQEDFQSLKQAAEKKKKSTITADSFDHQVASKMGSFFEDDFLPAMKRLVQAHLSYDDVKKIVKIPSTWGAKISGDQFKERAAAFFSKR